MDALALSRLAQALLKAMGPSPVLANLSADIPSMVASLEMGGIAVVLAVQTSLSNVLPRR